MIVQVYYLDLGDGLGKGDGVGDGGIPAPLPVSLVNDDAGGDEAAQDHCRPKHPLEPVPAAGVGALKNKVQATHE